MSRPKVGIITNMRSRKNRRNPWRVMRLKHKVAKRGVFAVTNTIDQLYKVVNSFKEQGIDLICINGGDGTCHLTLTAIVHVYGKENMPYIGILKGGTMNTTAVSLGIKGNTFSILERILSAESFDDLDFASVLLLEVEEKRYGFIFGNGLVANFVKEYFSVDDPTPARAAGLLLKGIGSAMVGGEFVKRILKRLEVDISVDGRRWPFREYTAILAATIEQVGLGFKPFVRVREKRDHFEIMGLITGAMGIITELPNIWVGKEMSNLKAMINVAKEVIIESKEEVPYILDGDFYYGSKRLVIRSGPEIKVVM